MSLIIIIGGKSPGSQIITATGSGSFTVPYYGDRLRVRIWGGGGGGVGCANTVGGSLSQRTTGVSGGATTFSAPSGTLTAGGGQAAPANAVGLGAGGTASGGDVNTAGETGGDGGAFSQGGANNGYGGAAGGTAYGGGARAIGATGTSARAGTDGNAYGGGGSGATGRYSSVTPPEETQKGGGGGGFVEKVYLLGQLNIGSSISYSVGAGGAGGVQTNNGGRGADGAIVIDWDY